jgi:DNA-binding winged helix-turn-helix (wHTH) protein/tetratricopeptide (TPR) repeat protein
VTSERRTLRLRFGVFEMDLDVRELRRRGSRLPLPPQPFAVLAELALRSGRVVTREELQALLWGDGVHVDHERGLNQCLNRIRRVLGDDARTPRFVETLPLQGYRFVASVEVVEGETAERPRPTTRPRLGLAAAVVLAVASGGGGRSAFLGSPSPRSRAQAAVVEGRRLLDEGPTGWRQSVELFGEALRQDPGLALAHDALADGYMRLGEEGALPGDEAFPAARRAALAGLAIEERASLLAILGAVELNYSWDWRASEAAYRRALVVDPDLIAARLGYARLLSAAGRHDEAVRLIGEAERRHPACAFTVRDAAFVHYRARRFDEAARRFRDWAGLEPDRPDPHHWLALLHHLRGRDDSAVLEARTVMALAKAAPEYAALFDRLAPRPAMQQYLRGSVGFLERLKSTQWVTADDLAPLRAMLGDRTGALGDLERAAAERSPRLLPRLNDPAFDAIRTDARFMALLRRVGLRKT